MAVAAAGAVHTATKWEDVKAKARRAWATTKLVIGLATQFIPDAGDVKKAGPEDDDPDKRRKPPIESDKGAIPLEGADTEDKRVRRHEQDRERAAAPRQ